MTKFKVGDKFIPHRPKNVNEYPCWKEEMAEVEGRLLTISMIDGYNNLITKETSWSFNPDWCEKVEHIGDSNAETTNRAQPIKPRFPADRIEKGQKPDTPSWDEEWEHIIEPNETIDWEQRRYEIAKHCLAAQINGIYEAEDYTKEVNCAIQAADELIKQLKESSEK
jgi:hypothetical protein